MSDGRVTFRLLALKADTVSALIGLKSAVNEPTGTTTTAMIKSAKGLWTVISGPFEPNLGRSDSLPGSSRVASRHLRFLRLWCFR